MKVVTVVGARPQFIKAAVVSRELRKNHKEILVHTGQHFDHNMSQDFFDELCIPDPDYNLGISGGTHAQMTGRMMAAIENVLKNEKPEWLLVYGDTNSTLAASLAAAKIHVPICHVEAGGRTGSMTNPEEINRICTDHISSLLLACTESCMSFLRNEGLSERAHLVGDPMYDAFIQYSGIRKAEDMSLTSIDGEKGIVPRDYYYLTCHREENTCDDAVLKEILNAMNSLEHDTIYPVHPRVRSRVDRLRNAERYERILFVEPVGYFESMFLVCHAKGVVTDSGGLQREAFFAGKKCVTVLDFVCWPETMVDYRNELSRPIAAEIVSKLSHNQRIDSQYQPFGDGKSSERIVRIMEQEQGFRERIM